MMRQGARVSAFNIKTTWVTVYEMASTIGFTDTVYADTTMTPLEARELARQLYRLARRIEKRKEATA